MSQEVLQWEVSLQESKLLEMDAFLKGSLWNGCWGSWGPGSVVLGFLPGLSDSDCMNLAWSILLFHMGQEQMYPLLCSSPSCIQPCLPVLCFSPLDLAERDDKASSATWEHFLGSPRDCGCAVSALSLSWTPRYVNKCSFYRIPHLSPAECKHWSLAPADFWISGARKSPYRSKSKLL